MKTPIALSFLAGGALALCAAASDGGALPDVKSWVAAHQHDIIGEFTELVSIPDLHADRPNIDRNAVFLRAMLEKHGMKAEIVQSAGNPLIIGEIRPPGATRTVLFYIHYDGQPITPKRWKQEDPFKPVMRDGRVEDGAKLIPDFTKLNQFQDEWRLYARGVADDKGPIEAFCIALDSSKGKLTNNVRVVLDGEEEGGGEVSLGDVLAKQTDKLKADLVMILDGPSHPSGRPTLYFGARGGTSFDLTVFGSKFALHSGHYGNWVPNAAMRLAQLLATMKDDDGRTTIAGFYDDIPPFTPSQRAMMRAVPDDQPALLKLFGIAKPDAVGENLQEALQFPSLNIHSIEAGEAGGVIPAIASAQVEMRLVKETQPSRMMERVIAHIKKQGYYVVDTPPSDEIRAKYSKIAMVTQRRRGGGGAEAEGGGAWRTESDSAEGVRVIAAMRKAWGADPVAIRTMGGSVPAALFIRNLAVPVIGLPTVNFDDNQHSDDENLRVGNLWTGAVSISALMR